METQTLYQVSSSLSAVCTIKEGRNSGGEKVFEPEHLCLLRPIEVQEKHRETLEAS